jgi:hypothetical protein
MLSARSGLKRIMFFVPLVLFLFLGMSSCTQAGGNAAAGDSPLTVLSTVSGKVLVQAAGSNSWIDGKAGMALKVGDKIKTDSSAAATVTFFDGSTIELKGDTEISFDELTAKSSSSPKTIRLGQTIGETTSRVVKLIDPTSRYEIETQAAVAAVRGSTMVVQVASDGATRVYNIEGTISITAQGKEVFIPAGSSSSAKPGEAPSAPQAGLPPGISASPGNSTAATAASPAASSGATSASSNNPWVGVWTGTCISTLGYYSGPLTGTITSTGGNGLMFSYTTPSGLRGAYPLTFTSATDAKSTTGAVVFTLKGNAMTSVEADSGQTWTATRQ